MGTIYVFIMCYGIIKCVLFVYLGCFRLGSIVMGRDEYIVNLMGYLNGCRYI